jgi:glycosyltransferase involved in cell wall biosynthesis
MDLFLVINIVFAFGYILFSFWLAKGWFSLKTTHCKQNIEIKQPVFFSVLIPFRNEAGNLSPIIHDLLQQDYPREAFELILIDDASEDYSVEEAEKAIKNAPIASQILHSSGGKKAAIAKGLHRAKGTHIISLDADVRIGKMLLQCYHETFTKGNFKLLAGPVRFGPLNTLFDRLQAVEFSSLISSAGSAINTGKPIMLNAANMGFEKAAALAFEEQIYTVHTMSGDDQFLMEAIAQKYGSRSIGFIKSPEAVATTPPQRNIADFFSQRIRWASKTGNYQSLFSRFIALFVAGFNLLLLADLALIPVNQWIFISLFLLKFALDFPLVFSGLQFLKQSKLIGYYLPVQLLYPFYVGTTVLLIPFVRVSWKNRRIK